MKAWKKPQEQMKQVLKMTKNIINFLNFFFFMRAFVIMHMLTWSVQFFFSSPSKKDIAEQIWLGVTKQPEGNRWIQPNGEIANISSETLWWSHDTLNQSTVSEYDCITMNTSTYLWENRDCSEKIAAGMICKIPNTGRYMLLPSAV